MKFGLLHGFAASSFTWRELVGPLGELGLVVPLERPWASVPEQIAATVGQLDRHGLDRSVLVGHSAGAEVALGVALRAPDRVSAMILLAPVVGTGPPRMVRAVARVPGTGAVAAPVLRASLRWLAPALRSAWYDKRNVTPPIVDGYRDPLRGPGVAEALWAMTGRADGQVVVARVGEVTQPCLVIVGSQDRWTTPLPLPRARTVVLEQCGHLPHEEQPERTLDAIRAFVRP